MFLEKKKTILSAVACFVLFMSGFMIARAAPTFPVSSTYPEYYAWNDALGWINFLASGTVDVRSDRILGYAGFGSDAAPNYISLDCSTGPVGSSCSPVTYGVTNDGIGNLAGWAWSDAVGWVSFSCKNPETGGTAPDYSCTQSNYGVKIDINGNFTGYAWNDTIGWISFNCNQSTGSTCGTVNYKLKSAWLAGPASGDLISGTFDTQAATGVAFNYILWRGGLNNGKVSFQFAASNCANGATDAPTCTTNVGWGDPKTSGDGAFLGPGGTTAKADTYTAGPEIPMQIQNQATHYNKRYFRYRIYVETSADHTGTAVVDDVVVNWSP